MKKIILAILIVVISAFFGLNFTFGRSASFAQNGSTDFQRVPAPAVSDINKTPFNTPFDLIAAIVRILLLAGGVAALIAIILSGVRYIMAGGDPEKAAQARAGLLASIIGFLIIASSYSIILYITQRILR